MKFAWRNDIGDLAAWNSFQLEEVDDSELKEFEDLLEFEGMTRDKDDEFTFDL
jgi:hypothetical protein